MASSQPTPSKSPRLMHAVLIVSALYFLARLVGLAQTWFINYFLEAGERDAYWAAFSVPDYLNYLVAGGALSITFIPIFTHMLQQQREDEAWDFFSTIATAIGGGLLVMIVIAEFAARPLVSIAASGLMKRPEVFDLTVSMTRVLLPAQWFICMGFLMVAVLNAYKRFGASAWAGALYNIIAIVATMILIWLKAGPIAFAWGILVGAFAGSFLPPLISALKAPPDQRPRFTPNFHWRMPAVRTYFLNALPIMLGASLPVVDQVVVRWFAAFMPEGVIGNLSTGNKFMIAAQGVIGQAASVAAYPFLSELASRNQWDEYARFLRDGLRRLIFVTLPLSTLMIMLARPTMVLLSGLHDPADIQQATTAFAFYCIGLFAWVAQQLVVRGFYAMRDTLTPTIIGSSLTVFFFIPFIAVLFFAHGGVLALALATSIAAGVQLLTVLIALEKRLARPPHNASMRLEKIVGLALRTLCACLCMMAVGGVATSISLRVFPAGKFGALLQMLFCTLVAGGAFAYFAERFEIPEWRWFSARFLARLKRRRTA